MFFELKLIFTSGVKLLQVSLELGSSSSLSKSPAGPGNGDETILQKKARVVVKIYRRTDVASQLANPA